MTLLDKYNQLRKENREKDREINELKKYLIFYRAWYCQRDYEQCKRRNPELNEILNEYERKNKN